MASPPILFLHIGWASEYRGDPKDPPQGKFGFIQEGNEDPGEALNFKPYKGRCYGYAPFHRRLNLQALGGARAADYIDGVLVIWTATDPDGSGNRFIVGWYKDARVYAELQQIRPNRKRPDIIAEASADDCHLVAVDDRTFYIPSMQTGWPGVSSVFYASQRLSDDSVEVLLAYMAGVDSAGFEERARSKPPVRKGRIADDPELRQKIEKAAVAFVRKYYEARKWRVQSVEQDHVGWDLDVSFGKRLLTVEVKGRGSSGLVELTPNEYDKMLDPKYRMNYRLAIVFNALSDEPSLEIFSYSPASDEWISENNNALELKEKLGAIATF